MIRHLNRSTITKTAMTLAVLGLATSATIFGSHASWSAQTSNSGNGVTAGTLGLTNSKDGAALFSASNIKPGDTASSTVTLKNTGSIPLGVSLTQDNIIDTLAASSMGLQVHDDTRNWCYWPTNAAGSCATFGTWDASTSFANLALPGIGGSAQWPAGEEHVFTVGWKLNTSSPNSDQGKTASFRLNWSGVQ